jgi:hypothetical protein
MQPTDKAYDDIVSECEKSIEAFNESTSLMSKWRCQLDPESEARVLSERQQNLSKLKKCRSLHDQMKDSSSRIPGHVQFSLRIEMYYPAPGRPHIRDWAIIELDASKFTTPLESLRNTLPVTLDLRANSPRFAKKRTSLSP